LATASAPRPRDDEPGLHAPVTDASRAVRRKTAHIKQIPELREVRQQIRDECVRVAAGLDKSLPLDRAQMETIAQGILERVQQPAGYLGWTMVMLASAFWHDQVASVPPSRRLFLVPHCLKQAEDCPGVYDETGLDCGDCRACTIGDYRLMAERLGYRVLVAEGTPIVMKTIVSGEVDALVGVACLNVLEKALDKILLAGIPCMAVPLLSSDCRQTAVDGDWVEEMLHVTRAHPVAATRTYVHLMRAASHLFQLDQLSCIGLPLRDRPSLDKFSGQSLAALDPIAGTQILAYDFLMQGGKYSRPFITLAAYDALTGGQGTLPHGDQHIARFPDAVLRTAMCIESFHKASLIHDDIEDNDSYRYGQETLHRRHGVPMAINVGDYLIGMGYRLVAREAADLGAEVAADLLHCLADAHTRLCEGQGAELLWRDAKVKRLTPLDALKIYALKTAPAFEAALYCGARLAGPAAEFAESFRRFARNLGVAFQILNDLQDWQGDRVNLRASGGDILCGRPTILWALALEALAPSEQMELISLVELHDRSDECRLRRASQLYGRADVADKAHQLVAKHQQRARSVADSIQSDELRRLLYYLIDTVLESPADETPLSVVTNIVPTRSPSLPSQ
jgi:geranylgeranyl pyrophosphate synthase